VADTAVAPESVNTNAPAAPAAPEVSRNSALPTPANALLEAALRYAKRGWPVIPIQPRDKRPLTRHGLNDASTDRAQIRRWWERYPNANIGVALWHAGLVIVDGDSDDGRKSLGDLTRQYGPLPPTLEAKTGRGAHFYFRGQAQSTIGKLGPAWTCAPRAAISSLRHPFTPRECGTRGPSKLRRLRFPTGFGKSSHHHNLSPLFTIL
jgi:hypothetical protein